MKYLYSLIFGTFLGASSVFIYDLYAPISLLFTLVSIGLGIWSVGRMWGRRSFKFIAAFAWSLVVLRAGFPGLNEEYLIQGNSIGISLINFGFIAAVIAILAPL
jgi:hypothetical protein